MRYAVFVLAGLLVGAAPAPHLDLDSAFRSVLEPDQARALSHEKELSVLARAFTPEQRAAVGAKLREAEGKTDDPRALAEIHRGYLALKDAEGAKLVGDALIARFPSSAVGYVMRGQAAELRGDFAGAAEQAREALRRDPNDRAAHALLRLSEGRADAVSSPASAGVMDGGASASGAFFSAPRSGSSPEALDLMRQAIAARAAGDLARVQALAQAAMNSDPKSAVVQRFHYLVQEDRRDILRTQVGLYAALERRDTEARARRKVAAELEAQRRVARRHQVPPVAPLTAGALLLTLGIMAWNYGLRDEAQRRANETKRAAAAGLMVLGCAGISYGASALLFGVGSSASSPALALAGGGTMATAAVPAEAAAVAGAAAGTALAREQYSFASGPGGPSESGWNDEAGVSPKTNRGAGSPHAHEIRFGSHKSAAKWQNQMKQRGWTEGQIREAVEKGQRFKAPNMVNPGNSATRYIHPTTGRYVVIDNVTSEVLQVGADGFNPPAL